MSRFKVKASVVLALLALSLLSAAGFAQSLSGTIAIDGSSTVFPITEAVAEEFQALHRGVRVAVGVSGSGGGLRKFCDGEIAISNASRPISTTEIASCGAKGVGFVELPVAFDGLAVMVHPSNDWVDYLTTEELKKVWAPEAQGKVTHWDHVRPGWPHKEIHLYGPGTDSGTYDYFTDAIVGQEGASRGDFVASEDDNVLVQGIAGDPLALGFFGYAYYLENQNRLKLVPIVNPKTGVAVLPTSDSIESGEYFPLSRPIFIYVSTTAAERPEVEAFVEYYLTEGPALVSEVGYVALPDNAYAAALDRFAARREGSVFSGGSQVGVSLQDLLRQ